MKIQEKSQISFCKILKNKWYHTKGLLLRKKFNLNINRNYRECLCVKIPSCEGAYVVSCMHTCVLLLLGIAEQ